MDDKEPTKSDKVDDLLSSAGDIRPDHIQIGKIGVGWSKVCRPDKWDPKKGKIIATARAARDLARQILTGDQSHLYEEQEDKEPSGSGAKTD